MIGTALFQYAAWWPLLLLAPLTWLVLHLRERARQRTLAQIIGHRAAEIAEERSRRRRSLRRAAFCAGLLLAFFAALGPLLGEARGEPEWRGVDLVVCLDVSRSMWARDLAPDRLGRAKREIRALAGAAEGDRLALVAFAGEARLEVPLTRDRATFVALADLADPTAMRRGGTDLGAALNAALAALEDSASEHSAILLLTDGEDLGGRGAAVAARCRRRGVAVHCLGLGTSLGSKIVLSNGAGEVFLRDRAGREIVSTLDATSLRRIAETAGGTYVDVNASTAPLTTLYEQRMRPMARRAFARGETRRRENRYQWPLMAALLLWLGALALVDRRSA